ncbi:hypothetical protein JHD50_10210 [Sulfurimonas sp. MAG313]|nr:hypothetical protein [Sulfurimonas sp. MAG313]MDF1881669.1 hypothetical protein [Sulfurimonas sp. MAG313]
MKKNTEMLEMLKSALKSTNTKISKVMLGISESRSAGKDITESKNILLALSEKKVLLQNKIQSVS